MAKNFGSSASEQESRGYKEHIWDTQQKLERLLLKKLKFYYKHSSVTRSSHILCTRGSWGLVAVQRNRMGYTQLKICLFQVLGGPGGRSSLGQAGQRRTRSGQVISGQLATKLGTRNWVITLNCQRSSPIYIKMRHLNIYNKKVHQSQYQCGIWQTKCF